MPRVPASESGGRHCRSVTAVPSSALGCPETARTENGPSGITRRLSGRRDRVCGLPPTGPPPLHLRRLERRRPVALVGRWAARTYSPGTRIAALFPDGPHRYLETVYNDAWCREHELLGQEPWVEPDEITEPDERVATGWTRCGQVRDPLARRLAGASQATPTSAAPARRRARWSNGPEIVSVPDSRNRSTAKKWAGHSSAARGALHVSGRPVLHRSNARRPEGSHTTSTEPVLVRRSMGVRRVGGSLRGRSRGRR